MTHFQTAQDLQTQFRALIHSGKADFIPRNVRRVKGRSICMIPDRNALGMLCDAPDAAGKIVAIDDGLIVIKEKPSLYCLMDPAIVPPSATLVVGAAVSVSPYKRKSLEDGLPLEAPRRDGKGFTVARLGGVVSKLPGRPKEEGYMRDMADQIERMPMPDGHRTLANALADWHATGFEWVSIDTSLTYHMTCKIEAPGYSGPLTIRYDRPSDTYIVETSERRFDDVYFDDLGNHLSGIAGDHDNWFFITITPVSKQAQALV